MAASNHPPIGVLLREWRGARRMSQLDLALEAGLSPRHLGFVETGRAQPSREAVVRLAGALALPLRERNALLLAGGYAPSYGESELTAPELERYAQAIDLILTHQEPYPAFLINRHFDVVMANGAAARVNAYLMQGRQSRHGNLLHQVFDPDDFRQVIVNWEELAAKFLRHLQEELVVVPSDGAARALLDEIMRYPGVPEQWRRRELGSEPEAVLTMTFRSPAGPIRFFETITTFATPRDVTLAELRIDCCYPADDRTARICAALARGEEPQLEG